MATIVLFLGVVIIISISAAVILRALDANRDALSKENSAIGQKIDELMTNINALMTDRTDKIDALVTDKTDKINELMANKTDELIKFVQMKIEDSGQDKLLRLSAQFEELKRKVETTYNQIDSLNSLHTSLRFRAPLPIFRGWSVSPDFANILARYVLEYKPMLVVGLGSGISDIIVGYCIERSGFGKMISLEHNEEYLLKTSDLIRLHNLSDIIEVQHCPLKEYKISEKSWYWYDWKIEINKQKIEMLIVDGPPGATQHLARYPALPLLRENLSDDCIVILDDAYREDEKDCHGSLGSGTITSYFLLFLSIKFRPSSIKSS